jgi:hypothetical protein
MNRLSLLVLQNKSYNPKIINQSEELFELISKAILDDKNYIVYNKFIYGPNRLILQSKGYFILNNIIYWDDYNPADNS